MILNKIRKAKSTLAAKARPKVVDIIIKLSTLSARSKLKRIGVKSLLVDNTVLFHGITHETAWVSTGQKTWGGSPIETGYSARIPVHDWKKPNREYHSVKYLAGIISLARRKYFELCLSSELRDEQFTQPMGRFKGYGMFDLSLFKSSDFRTIIDPDYRVSFGAPHLNTPSIEEQRKRRLASKTDPLYLKLLKVLGEKNSQDIWHIVTAERNDCYCFLTMDYRLIKNVEAQKNNPAIKSLVTKVMSPEQFGKEFGLAPIHPRMLSYQDSSWFVRADLFWADSKRKSPRQNI